MTVHLPAGRLVTLNNAKTSSLHSSNFSNDFNSLDVVHEAADKLLWCFFKSTRPNFTIEVLDDLQRLQDEITLASTPGVMHSERAVEWVVLASHHPKVFSLGGDLEHFANMIETGDTEGLRDYAYSCVDVSYRNSSAYGGGAISIGLAQGDALGGGFESLLSCDVLIAERKARFGLPEVLMNMFPGMGAHCFLTRRVGSSAALRMILTGEVFSAEAMHAAGVVDLVVEDGEGEQAAHEYVLRHRSRHRAHLASYKARNRVSPVSLQELRDVTDIWVDTAMSLTPRDLRRMKQLSSAQARSFNRQASLATAAE